jgi:hypothetical protein
MDFAKTCVDYQLLCCSYSTWMIYNTYHKYALQGSEIRNFRFWHFVLEIHEWITTNCKRKKALFPLTSGCNLSNTLQKRSVRLRHLAFVSPLRETTEKQANISMEMLNLCKFCKTLTAMLTRWKNEIVLNFGSWFEEKVIKLTKERARFEFRFTKCDTISTGKYSPRHTASYP